MDRKIFPFAKQFVRCGKCRADKAVRSAGSAFVKMLFLPASGEFGQFRLLSAPNIYMLHQKGFQIANFAAEPDAAASAASLAPRAA